MSKKSRVPFRGIPDNPAQSGTLLFQFCEAMKENLEILLGHRRNVSVRDRMVTHQDLVDYGLITESELKKK